MKTYSHQKYRRFGFPLFIGLLYSACIIFLQVGITYYLSFQILAFFLLLIVVAQNKPVFVNLQPMLLTTIIFAVFLLFTAFNMPSAISQNSGNIFITFLGVMGYVLMIIVGPNIAFQKPENILHFFRFVSAVNIITIAALIILTDLAIIPLLNRETLILQNTTLIDNFTTMDVLLNDFAFRNSNGIKLDIDLFYGEQSFLAVVIFASITTYIISEKLLQALTPSLGEKGKTRQKLKSFSMHNISLNRLVLVAALGSMVYIQSFSSFFYVLVICLSLFLSMQFHRFSIKLNLKSVLFFLLAIIVLVRIVWTASTYYIFRLTTVSDSVSFEQRFNSIFNFSILDYLIGITHVADIPQYGYHNGIIYVIAISGFGGICFLAFLFYRTYILSRAFKLSFLAIMCILAIFSQNGGVFSPSKVVLLLSVFIPLSCANQLKLTKTIK